jgi:hypothetical protein
MRNYKNVQITYVGQNGEECVAYIPRDLKIYIDNLEKDVFDAFALYDLISLSLYHDEYVWSTLPSGAFHEDILRNFFNGDTIEKIKGMKNGE